MQNALLHIHSHIHSALYCIVILIFIKTFAEFSGTSKTLNKKG